VSRGKSFVEYLLRQEREARRRRHLGHSSYAIRGPEERLATFYGIFRHVVEFSYSFPLWDLSTSRAHGPQDTESMARTV